MIELIIALFIFSLISSAGVYALRLAIEGQEQLTLADKNLREWQLARIIIKEDLAQVTNRVVRDEDGVSQTWPVIGGLAFQRRRSVVAETPLMGFVRRGWRNPEDRSPRSTLQYVEYVHKDDNVIRRVRPYLDDAPGQPKIDRILFSGVSTVTMTFMINETTRGLEWGDLWPVAGSGEIAPRAIKLEFEKDGVGFVEQLFWIGGIS